MVCEFPVWVHLARKTPVRAAVRGRVYEIGAPERPDGEVLLTVWTGGRAVGQVLATEPPVLRFLTLVIEPCGLWHELQAILPSRTGMCATERSVFATCSR